MLYDPKWERPAETKVDPLSLGSLIAWLKTKPRNETYSYMDCRGACLFSQFMAAQGFQWRREGDGGLAQEWIGFHEEPWINIALDTPHTFGAALERARKLVA